MNEIEPQQARSGRRCVVCSSADRSAIESELVSGSVSIRGTAARWGLSPESLRRHTRNHLDESVQAAQVAVQGVPTLDILIRLLDLATDAHDFRTHLEETGNDRLVAQAFRAEAATLGYLADRLGITKMPTQDLDRTMRSSLAEAVGVLRVVARVAVEHPRVGDVLADRLDQLSLPELAAQVREQADTGRALILETKETP